MEKDKDTMLQQEEPDRLHYATGVLLGAEDFQAEQDYHRSRLARALTYAMGYGTLAGLEVKHEPAQESDTDGSTHDERLLIKPGMAIDRLGRLIEVTSTRCLKLVDWYRDQPIDALRQAWHASGTFWSDSPSGVAADLFIRFVVCKRGKTPAFASSAFDTFDSVTAARLRDGFELKLELRQETDPPEPQPQWQDFTSTGDSKKLRQAIYDAWQQGNTSTTAHYPDPSLYLPEQDTSALFLARILLPADQGASGSPPVRRITEQVVVRDELRPFVLTANALANWLGIQARIRLED